MQWDSFLSFLVTNLKITHIRWAWSLLLDFIISNSSCCSIFCAYSVMGCGWLISSYVLCMMITALPVTKNPLVYSSASEAATNFKMLQFICIGTFRRSHAHLKVFYLRKNILQRNCELWLSQIWRIVGRVKHYVWSLNSDHCIWICSHVIKNWCIFFSYSFVGSFIVAIVINGNKNMLSNPIA